MPKRILIADDETSVRRAIRSFVEARSQFEVCEAVDGTEALEKARSLNPDLIVLDLSMPSANGVEVALLLSSTMPRTPVVLYTMFDEVFGASPTRNLGVTAIVAKSDGVAKLLARIEALLKSSEGLTPQEVSGKVQEISGKVQADCTTQMEQSLTGCS
jgi:DNA-binding NarL/FixJ family response regulator